MTINYLCRLKSNMKVPLCSLVRTKFSFSSLSCIPTRTFKEKSNITSKESDIMFLFKKCSHIRDVMQLHSQIIQTGHHQTLSVIGKIIVFCAVSEHGDMGYAVSVFKNIESPDGFLWNTMIRGFSKSSKPVKAFEYYKLIQENGFVPDNSSFYFLLKACRRTGSVVLWQQMHCSILKHGLESHEFATRTFKEKSNITFEESDIMFIFKKCSHIRDVMQLHSQIIQSGHHQTLFVIGKIIVFCAVSEHGDMGYAVSVFENIESPDGFLWNTMIRGFSKSSEPVKAFEYYKLIQENGFVPDNFSFSFLLKACGRMGSVVLGQQMHCTILKHGLESHEFVRSALVHMYGMVKDIETASQLFEEIPEPELVAWNIIIDCHVCCGRYKEALNLFWRMLPSGVEPDEATFLVTLSACSAMGALDFGRWVHSCIDRTSLGGITSVSNSLINMYAKCGALEEAYEMFNKMTMKNIVSWNTMILGLASHGHAKEALSLFEKMLQENVERPDDITFVGVFCACSHGGMVDEGRRYFDMMCKDYHIKPTIRHYGCMVDILGRAGFLEEAYQLIRSMPVESNAIIWRTELAACRLHGEVELGEKVKQHLSELEPDNSSDYVLLANMYASVGKWNEVMRVRKSMQDRGVQKPEPGNSFTGTVLSKRSELVSIETCSNH